MERFHADLITDLVTLYRFSGIDNTRKAEKSTGDTQRYRYGYHVLYQSAL